MRQTGVTRNPSAIKQMLLDWCKAQCQGYEVSCSSSLAQSNYPWENAPMTLHWIGLKTIVECYNVLCSPSLPWGSNPMEVLIEKM